MRRYLGIALLVALLVHCSSESSPGNGHPDAGKGSGGTGITGGTGGTSADASAGTGGTTTSEAGDAQAPVEDVSAVFEPIRSNAGLPALAGAVWKDGQLTAVGVSGVRKLGDPTPAEIGDQWHLGSDTKAMTATLIGIHVDKGDIHFDDTIATLFAGETIDPGYAAVTVVQLLQHRGGAPETIPSDIWSQMWADGSAPDARIKAVRALISRPPAQSPGTFAYANAGYMIAGAALERITGKSWEASMQEEIFGPLGMPTCGFGAPGTAGSVDEPWGHDQTQVPKEPGPNADNPPSLGPAGTVHCSLADWGKFLLLHLAGARGEQTALVSQTTVKTLQTPPAGGDYACGWGVVDRAWAGGLALSHSGSNTFWYATAWLAPLKNVAFAVVTNQGGDVAAKAVDDAFGPLIQKYAN